MPFCHDCARLTRVRRDHSFSRIHFPAFFNVPGNNKLSDLQTVRTMTVEPQ